MGFIVKPFMEMMGYKAPEAPKMPEIAKESITSATPAVQAAADAERKRLRSARGKASTMLTSSQGDAVAGSSVGTTKLLGG